MLRGCIKSNDPDPGTYFSHLLWLFALVVDIMIHGSTEKLITNDPDSLATDHLHLKK